MTNPPASGPPLVYYLHAANDLALPAPPTDPSLPAEVNGQPAAYFWADAIRTGRYVHPLGRFELNVNRQRLDTWERNYRRMREAGIGVPVPVDHSSRARDNLGYVVDVKRDGDRLLLLHQLIGDDAIKLAARNKVSLGIDPAFKTSAGETIGDCIIHSSLTPNPVVPGQQGLVPMSREADEPANDDDSGRGVTPIVFHLAVEPPADAILRDRQVDLLLRRVDYLLTGGHITPACRDRLMLLFRSRDRPSASDADPRGAILHLSRDGDFAAIEALLDAFEQNRALVFGERTGLQTLSRVVPDDDQPVNAALQSRMVRMANGGR